MLKNELKKLESLNKKIFDLIFNIRRYSMFTRKLYWHDTYLYEHKATVIDSGKDEKGYWLKLDSTIVHPQGGGQPLDEASINDIKVIKVEEARDTDSNVNYDMGILTHYLAEDLKVNIGDQVSIKIDKDKRLLHSALHTAGHILAGTMRTQHGYKKQTGANHFPKEARIEFIKDGSDFQQSTLQEEATKIISGNKAISANFQEVPDIYKDPKRNSMARCITIAGLWTEPCSGTHLKTTGELSEIVVRSKKEQKGKIAVGYDAKYGLFSSEKINSFKDEAVAKDPLNDKTIRELITANGMKIKFMMKKGTISAEIEKENAIFQEIAADNIYINIDNSPEKSEKLSNKNLNWQLAALEQLNDVSMLFNGSIVITKLNSWNFNKDKIANSPSLQNK